MKLPGRTPILVELSDKEYSALARAADEKKISMTVIVRDLIRENLMKDTLLGAVLSKRILHFSSDGKQAIVVHLADEEHDKLKEYANAKSSTITLIVRNLIRKHIMNAPELDAED